MINKLFVCLSGHKKNTHTEIIFWVYVNEEQDTIPSKHGGDGQQSGM